MATNGKSEALALAIASGSTIKDAAVVVGCSERSAYRHSATPKFRQRVNELRSEITTQAIGRLTEGTATAAATLLELLDASNEPSIRLAAAKTILASVGPISELGELRTRLDALEQNKCQQV
jgi:hypothetical protein